MDGAHTHRQIFVRNTTESGRLDHALKVVLLGELSDALHQILVRLPLARQYLAHWRDHGEGILVVDPIN